ncbi:hypothetical protein [Paenibacillus sp. FSL M7-0420]|uniref:hypothetical protein n=1 Tax=Paenibacillus sp. FSL M7-0420 TaxID=2921609 RepID=UPI0030FA56A6
MIVVLSITLTGCKSNKPEEISNSAAPIVPSGAIAIVTPVPTPIPQENALKGYLFTEETGLLFISWTEQQQELNGTMQRTSKSKEKIETESYPFTGGVSDKNISLNFQGGIFSGLNGITITGTFDKGSLTLYFPNQKDGSLLPASFTVATVDDYNQAVSILRNEIEQSKALAAKQKEAEEQELANKKQQSAVEHANQRLSEAIQLLIKNMESNKNIAKEFEAVFQSYEQHWGEMKKHKQDLLNAAKVRPFNFDQLYIVQDKLYILGNDEYQIQNDAYQIGNVEYDFSNYLDALKSQGEGIRLGWEQLQTAAAQNSSGTPLPKYTEVEVNGYMENLEQELTEVESTLLEKKKSASVYDEKAKNLLQEMTDYVDGLVAVEDE